MAHIAGPRVLLDTVGRATQEKSVPLKRGGNVRARSDCSVPLSCPYHVNRPVYCLTTSGRYRAYPTGVAVGVADGLGVALQVGVLVGVAVGSGVAVAVGVGVVVRVGVIVGVGVAVGTVDHSSAPTSKPAPKGRAWPSMSSITPASTPWSTAAEVWPM